MNTFTKTLLPTEVVFHPSWWNKHAGIIFDEDFFYHPLRRVEDERKMERLLHERFGEFGLGADHDKDLPQIGAVHLAAGYLLSEMLGCQLKYSADASPQVICAHREDNLINEEDAFNAPSFKKLLALIEALKNKHGYVCGDINWGGVLNLALDLKGENILMDMVTDPEACKKYMLEIASVIERFFTFLHSQTGTTSISVNRTVRLLDKPVYFHSECSHAMISEADYLAYLFPIDKSWSEKYRPYGIHYCGRDPHRHISAYAKLPCIDFFDLGWGGDVALIRKHLPGTLLNIRLNPTELNQYSHAELERIICDRVAASGDPWLTGVCCINMDANTDDEKIRTIFRTAERLRKETSRKLVSSHA